MTSVSRAPLIVLVVLTAAPSPPFLPIPTFLPIPRVFPLPSHRLLLPLVRTRVRWQSQSVPLRPKPPPPRVSFSFTLISCLPLSPRFSRLSLSAFVACSLQIICAAFCGVLLQRHVMREYDAQLLKTLLKANKKRKYRRKKDDDDVGGCGGDGGWGRGVRLCVVCVGVGGWAN